MARHTPAVERPPVARRPAGRAVHRRLIEVITGALFIAVAGSLITLPPPEHGEKDSASMVYLILCLTTLILGLLLLYVFIAGVRLPPALAKYLVLATVAATVAALLLSFCMTTPKAKQQGKCVIPVSGSSLPSFGNDGECPLFCEVGRRGKVVVCF